MSCDKWLPMLLLTADNRQHELDATAVQRLTAHLAECAECRQALDEQRTVVEVLATRKDARVPAGFAARVVSHVDVAGDWVDLLRWRIWTYRLAPVAAGLLLLAFVAIPGRGESTQVTGIPELAEVWAFGSHEGDSLPAFVLLGQENVSGALLLDVILSTEPDEPLTVGDPS